MTTSARAAAQTLLFSAAETRSVRALARSLAKEGTEYLAVHEVRARATHAVRPCSFSRAPL